MAEAGRDGALGYVAQVGDGHTYVGGLFLVGPEGDPLDFAYTEPVTLSPLERFLLGPRAEAYLLARVMMPALVAQAKVRPSVLVLDDASLLLRRARVELPVVVVALESGVVKDGAWERLEAAGAAGLAMWVSQGSQDGARGHVERAIAEMAPFTILEPFEQVRRTLREMRRGVR
ncbi:MAG TPA: hypothetical protein VFQ51_13480 [Vicinamibacteria bacterium]|nr:hypothetical protein [Vicinamibacteria bacterium]